MKSLLIFLFCLFSLDSFSASSIEVDVLFSEYGVEDYDGRKTLCLTVVRFPASGRLLGVVESIEDCFYARLASRSGDQKIELSLGNLQKITHPEQREHLQRLDGLVEFYFSDGE